MAPFLQQVLEQHGGTFGLERFAQSDLEHWYLAPRIVRLHQFGEPSRLAHARNDEAFEVVVAQAELAREPGQGNIVPWMTTPPSPMPPAKYFGLMMRSVASVTGHRVHVGAGIR